MKLLCTVSRADRNLPDQGKQALALSGTVTLLIPVNSGKFTEAATMLPQTGVVAVNVAVLPVRLMNWLDA